MLTKRERSIETEIDKMESDALRAVSQMQTATNLIKTMMPWLHHALTHETGEAVAERRAELSATLDPALLDLSQMMIDLQEVAAIYSDDATIYRANLDAYLAKHPNAMNEAETRL